MATQQAEKEHQFWNAVVIGFFGVLCAISFWLLSSHGNIDLGRLGFFDIVLLGLATFRVIHLITYDRLFDFARVAVMDNEGGRLKAAERGWRRVVCELMGCLWCTGLWSALIVVTVDFLGTWGRLATLILAVAGFGSLLQVVSKAIAAEH